MNTSKSMPSTAVNTDLVVNPESIDGEYLHVVAGIVWQPADESRFLIAQRQQGKHLQGLWEFPGGKLEQGEDPWQGLQRELAEEIAISALDGSPFMQVYCRYPERNVLLDIWVVQEYQGVVRPAEQQRLQWITVAEADQYQWPAADIPVIEAIANSVPAGTRYSP